MLDLRWCQYKSMQIWRLIYIFFWTNHMKQLQRVILPYQIKRGRIHSTERTDHLLWARLQRGKEIKETQPQSLKKFIHIIGGQV